MSPPPGTSHPSRIGGEDGATGAAGARAATSHYRYLLCGTSSTIQGACSSTIRRAE
jgi:hypothetical protein